MKYANLLICSILSLVLGYTLLNFLTCHPLHMNSYLFASCVLTFAIVLLCLSFKRRNTSRYAVFTCMMLFTLSYLVSFYFFMNPAQNNMPPDIMRPKGDKGLGHTAIILLAHGEPETYDPGAWIKQMKEFDEEGTPFIPYPFRPIFFYNLREKYLVAGSSKHNLECLQIMEQIQTYYRNKGDQKTKFYISYLENEPHPDAAVIQALNDGASKIILCNLFLTISSHTQEAINLIQPLNLKDYGVEISYTKPLYDSRTLQKLYIDAIKTSTQSSDKENIGVILVGHGQPLEWDKKFYTQTQQEISFRMDILKQLVQEGYPAGNLQLAWMEFRPPSPKDAVKQLIQNNVKVVFYFSTIIGTESIHAKYDVPQLMNQIDIPSTMKLKQLTAFQDKTGIVKALVERIEACE